METVFSGESFRLWLDAAALWLTQEIFTATTVVYTAMQIPALVGAGFSAWWVHDFIHPVLEARIGRSTGDEYSRFVWLTLASLIFPGLWLAGLWSSIAVAVHFSWPRHLLRIGANLLSAWIAIRLAVILARDPIWSRAVAIVVYSVAALNILDLLDPTLALLNRLAVTLGTLRATSFRRWRSVHVDRAIAP